jgi:hypothetical protein
MKPFVRKLPTDLTSYDFLKSLAVITMLIDHIGYYFFPEQLEWRAIGRMSLPIWMFLIGYANTRDLHTVLWGGGLILLVGNVVAGMPLMPLNILFTIMIIRLSIDYVMRIGLSSYQAIFLLTFFVIVLAVPTLFVFDYGTQAFLFAMFGYLARHFDKLTIKNPKQLLHGFLALSAGVYIAYQKIIFDFDTSETLIMVFSVLTSCYFLLEFKVKLFPVVTKEWPPMIVNAFRFMGRKTLEIYVVHLLVFKGLGMLINPERFQLFQWGVF